MVLRFFMLACAFIFISCVTAERDNPNDPGSDNYRGYQIIDPPSSSTPSSSSFVAKSSSSGEAYSSSSMISSSTASAAKSSGSAVVSSSSSKLGSSSSAPPSSSSLAQSSVSVAVSSSSSMPSSSYSVPPSSSSVALSSSSVVVYSSSSKPSSSSSASPSSSSVAQSSVSVAVSSSSLPPSSSSVVPSSSSVPIQSNVVYGTPVTYGGETYQTVVIGTQTWFKRNLNYAVSGSKCGNGSTLSDANTETCDTYGRLYNWATAMNLPASCNTNSCASQVGTKHRGICPIGWHIPSDVDWNVLMKYVNPSCSDNSHCDGAGTKLKATSGWNSFNGIPAGTDNYGFSALPGGIGNSDGSFGSVGDGGFWWSTSEDGSRSAYRRGMGNIFEDANWLNLYKVYLLSVRCLQD